MVAIGAIKLPTINPKFWMCGDHWNSIQMSGLGVRRGKAARFPVGASPTRPTLQPEATGAVMEVTKWLKPSV